MIILEKINKKYIFELYKLMLCFPWNIGLNGGDLVDETELKLGEIPEFNRAILAALTLSSLSCSASFSCFCSCSAICSCFLSCSTRCSWVTYLPAMRVGSGLDSSRTGFCDWFKMAAESFLETSFVSRPCSDFWENQGYSWLGRFGLFHCLKLFGFDYFK